MKTKINNWAHRYLTEMVVIILLISGYNLYNNIRYQQKAEKQRTAIISGQEKNRQAIERANRQKEKAANDLMRKLNNGNSKPSQPR